MSKKTARPEWTIEVTTKCKSPKEPLFTMLDEWAREPNGYAIIRESREITVMDINVKGRDITVVRVPQGGKALMRELEEIREKYDVDPKGFSPMLVIVPEGVEKCPAWWEFSRRTEFLMEV